MNNNDALIGYTGFVGHNLAAQHNFNYQYNSQNIKAINNKTFDLVVCAGARGTKWLANKFPEDDLSTIQKLIASLTHIRCRKFVLISTIDVYTTPVGGDESNIDFQMTMPYGLHRHLLEKTVIKQFPNHLIIRLPGLFGDGLKKNPVFDFMQHHNLEQIHQDGIYQYYFLDHLWNDIEKAIINNISVLNVATEPVTIQEISMACRNKSFLNNLSTSAPHYDCHSKFAALWEKSDQYLYLKDTVLDEMRSFARTTSGNYTQAYGFRRAASLTGA